MNKIKNIIFDAGGVLVLHDWQKIKLYMLKRYNFSTFLYSDYPKKIQKKYKGLQTGKISFKEVLKELSGQKDITRILKDYEMGYKKAENLNLKLLTFLEKIKKRYQLFALTNTNDLHFKLNIKRGIFKNFRKAYASSQIRLVKPNKKAFLIVLKENKLNPIETLFVDDRQENLDAAKRLGMKALIFKSNKQFFNQLKKLGIK